MTTLRGRNTPTHRLTPGKINLIRQAVRLAEICGKFSPLNRTRGLVIQQALPMGREIHSVTK